MWKGQVEFEGAVAGAVAVALWALGPFIFSDSCEHFTTTKIDSNPSQLQDMADTPFANINCDGTSRTYLLAFSTRHPPQSSRAPKPKSNECSLHTKVITSSRHLSTLEGTLLEPRHWSMSACFGGVHPRLTFQDEVPEQRMSRAVAGLLPLSTAKEISPLALRLRNYPSRWQRCSTSTSHRNRRFCSTLHP
jgi:hypothetical protein